MSTTISKAENLIEMAERLAPDAVLTQHGITSEEYEELTCLATRAAGASVTTTQPYKSRHLHRNMKNGHD